MLAALACGGGDRQARDVPAPREKTAVERSDSVRVAGLAREALARHGQTDSLIVVSYTRGANGWLLKLVPAENPELQQGGGSVWVDADGSATVMQAYRP